jgi:hypothetical protein
MTAPPAQPHEDEHATVADAGTADPAGTLELVSVEAGFGPHGHAHHPERAASVAARIVTW